MTAEKAGIKRKSLPTEMKYDWRENKLLSVLASSACSNLRVKPALYLMMCFLAGGACLS